MKVHIVEIIETKLENGDVVAEAKIVGDDNIFDTTFTLPQFESRPINGTKMAVFQAGSGDYFFFGIPQVSALQPGEMRMFWTTSSGTLKGEIVGKNDGSLLISAIGGDITVRSTANVNVEATKISLSAIAGGAPVAEVIADLWTAFTALSTATAGGFPFTCAPALVTEVAQLALVKK